MNSKFVRFINSPVYRILVAGFLFFLFIVIFSSLKIFGYRCFTNSSNSMTPFITTGSLTIVHPADFYEVGESISYYLISGNQAEIITHRITAIGGNVYVTKGDANQINDRELVPARLVIGKVIMVIPGLGYILSFVKSFWGTVLTIWLPVALIVAAEWIRIVIELTKKQKNTILSK